MCRPDVLACMLEIAPTVLDVVAATYELPSQASPPSPRTDSDHWKCPSADEIARVCGGAVGPGKDV